MRALIIYDTTHGMTELVAQAIASGLRSSNFEEVEVKKADTVVSKDFRKAEVWVVGSPTHMGQPTPAVLKVLKTGLKNEVKGKFGAAFDTRMEGAKGGAVDALRHAMSQARLKFAAKPEHFIVQHIRGPLAEGEEARAVAFGRSIANAANKSG